MNDRLRCHDMEMLCRQRANVDAKHNWKWLGEADRWRELGHREIAWRFQQKNVQQMHVGPMAMGPNTAYGDSRSKQGPLKNEQQPNSSDLAKSNNLEVE